MLRGWRSTAALPITAMRAGSSLVRRSTTRSERPATRPIVFGIAGFVVEDRNADHDLICRSAIRRERRPAQSARMPNSTKPASRETNFPALGSRPARRIGRTAAPVAPDDRRNEFESALRNRLDKARIVAAVAERGANLREAVRECRDRNRRACPCPTRRRAAPRGVTTSPASRRAGARAPSPAAARAPRRGRSCAALSFRRRIRRRRSGKSSAPSVSFTAWGTA